jgi:hypothetical protein
VKAIDIQSKNTTMDILSSFLFDNVIGSLDVDRVLIIHDAPRLPSTRLINMNRRAMGMEDLHLPIFMKEERKYKNRWEVEGLLVRTRSCPDLAVEGDLASSTKSARRPSLRSRQCSDSMLLRPRRQPSSCPDSPTELLTCEGLEGRTVSRGNMHRWTSSFTSCVDEKVTSTQANGATASISMTREDRRTLMDRPLSDSNLVMPTRCPITPTKKEVISSDVDEALVRGAEYGRHERKKNCTSFVKDEATSPQANGGEASMSMSMTSDSNLVMPTRCPITLTKKESTSSDVDEALVRGAEYDPDEGKKTHPYDYLQKQGSDRSEGSLRTIDLEADGGSTEHSSSQVLETYSCGSTEFHRLQRSSITAASLAETELHSLTSTSTSISLTGNFAEEDTGIGNHTKFLACCNDSLLLLLDAEGARSQAKNLRGGQQSRETLKDYHDALQRRKSRSEETRGNISVSTLMSSVSTLVLEDAASLTTTP